MLRVSVEFEIEVKSRKRSIHRTLVTCARDRGGSRKKQGRPKPPRQCGRH